MTNTCQHNVFYFDRKRYSGSTLPVPDNVTSASSREGGDEYSSEASELDTQVLYWACGKLLKYFDTKKCVVFIFQFIQRDYCGVKLTLSTDCF